MIHDNASVNYEIGAISKARMREYDEMCLAEESNTKQNFESQNKRRAELVAV
jgi:DNA-binding transcriptional regulator YiaG